MKNRSLKSLPFFAGSSLLGRLLTSGLFVPFFSFILFVTLSNTELDPFGKTITIFMLLWAISFALHISLMSDEYYLDQTNRVIVNIRGYPLLKRKKRYLAKDMRSIEIRSATVKQADRHTSATIRYYCVLLLDDDEVSLQGSYNLDETKEQVKELSKALGKPYRVSLDSKAWNNQKSNVSIFRTLLLLVIVIVGLVMLYIYFSGCNYSNILLGEFPFNLLDCQS